MEPPTPNLPPTDSDDAPPARYSTHYQPHIVYASNTLGPANQDGVKSKLRVSGDDLLALKQAADQLQRSLQHFDDSVKKLSDIAEQLNSSSYLAEAAARAGRSISLLRSIDLANLTTKIIHVHGTSLVDLGLIRQSDRDSDTYSSSSNVSDSNLHLISDTQYDVSGEDGHESTSLLSILRSFASASSQLYNALCDIESYRLLQNDYKMLLVLHDELETMCFVIHRFGHQGMLQHFLMTSYLSLASYCSSAAIALDQFSERGSEGIKTAQVRIIQLHLNIAQITTFLAGVTATTLQFTFDRTTNSLDIATNTLWITSLMLSIGSAMNCFLALAWRTSPFSRPGKRVSWWARFWIRRGCLVFLITSCILFLLGMACFTFSTQKAISFWILLGTLVVLTFGLLSVSAWILRDRRLLSRWISRLQLHELQSIVGNRWLSHRWLVIPSRHIRELIASVSRDRQDWRKRPAHQSLLRRPGSRVNFPLSRCYWTIQNIVYDLGVPLWFLYKMLKSVFKRGRGADEELGHQMETTANVLTAAMIFNRNKLAKQSKHHLRFPFKGSLDIQFSPDGKWLVSVNARSVRVFSVETRVNGNSHWQELSEVAEFSLRTERGRAKIAWKTEGTFYVFAIQAYYHKAWFIDCEEFSVSLDRENKPKFVREAQTSTWTLRNEGDLISSFSWKLGGNEPKLFNWEGNASKLRAIQDIQDMLDSLLAMFRKLDGDQLEVPNPSSKKPKAESQVYSCRCERPMVLILHLDIKRDVLRTETTARRFYALGFKQAYGNTEEDEPAIGSDEKELRSFCVPLSGKVLNVTFNFSKTSTSNTAEHELECHHTYEFLISFATAPPQLWKYNQVTSATEVSASVELARTYGRESHHIARKQNSWGVSSFIHNGQHILTPINNHAHIYEKETGALLKSIEIRCGRYTTLAAASVLNGRTLCVLTEDDNLVLWQPDIYPSRQREATGASSAPVAGPSNHQRREDDMNMLPRFGVNHELVHPSTVANSTT